MMKKLLVILTSILLSKLAFAQQANRQYEQALELFNKNELATAQIAAKNSLQQNPNFLPARILLGKILLKQGQIGSAEKEYTVALTLNADIENVIIPLAETKLLQHKYQDALNLLEEYSQLTGLPRYLTLKASALDGLGQTEASYKTLKHAVDIHGDSIETSNLLAEMFIKKEAFEDAKKHIDIALQIDQNAITTRLLLAQFHTKTKAYQSALTEYKNLKVSHPENEQVLFGLTRLYLKTDRLTKALNEVVILRRVAPNNPYAKLLHSSIIALQGDSTKARMILSEIQQQLMSLSDEQKNSQALLLLSASVNFTNQQYQQARIEYQRYLRDYGENKNVRKQLATIAFRSGQLSTAKEHIDKALVTPSDSTELYLLACKIYQQTLSKSAYLTFITEAHTKLPTNDIISRLYINALIANGNVKAANALLKDLNLESTANKVMLGFIQLQQKELAQAKVTVQSLLDKHPNKIEVVQLAGELSLKLGHQADAISLFNHALALDEKFAPALLSLAGIHINNQALGLAEKQYRQYLAFYPNDDMVLRLYADLAIKQKHFDLAIKLLSAVNEDASAYRKSQTSLLSLLVATNQLESAQQLIEKLREVDTFDQELLLVKAQVEKQQGRISEAQKSLKMLFGLAYDEPTKLIKIASLQLDFNDLLAANKTITRLAQLSDVPPYLSAQFALASGDYAKSKLLIDANVDKQLTSASWQELHAYWHIAQESYLEAIAIIKPIYTQFQKRAHLQLLTQLYTTTGDVRQATTLLADWLKKQSGDAWAVAQLAQLAEQNGNLEQAISAYELFKNLEHQPIFLNNLAVLYQKTGLTDKAITIAKKAYKLEPNLAPINDTLGWLLIEKGQTEQGLSYLREAIARDASNATYHFHLAYALAQLKSTASATEVFEKAKKLAPNHPLIQRIEALIRD